MKLKPSYPLPTRNRWPLLFQLSRALMKWDVKGAYSLYTFGKERGLFDVACSFTLSDKSDIWAPLTWPGIFRYDVFERYEPDALDLMAKAINHHGGKWALIDCGADIGVYTRLLMARTKNISHVYCLEPNSDVEALLKRNIYALNVDTYVEQCAVSDFEGYGVLKSPDETGDAHACYLEASENPKDIPVRTIDSLDAPANTSLALKIDVEGAEMNVLKGAEKLLRSAPALAIQVEAHPEVCKRTNTDPIEILQFLKGMRAFSCWACNEKTREAIEVTDFETPLFTQLEPNQIYDLVLISA